MKIVIDSKARTLARQTGVDKLGQEKLRQLDKNGDGKVTLTDVRTLVRTAGLDKDGVLSRDDRKAINQVLGLTTGGGSSVRGGGGEATVTPRRRGGGGEATVTPRRGGGGESIGGVGGFYVNRGGGGGSSSWGGGGGE